MLALFMTCLINNLMRIFVFLTTLYAALVIYSVTASAKDDPIALQVSDWVIMGANGAQQVSASPDQCTMSVDYDNGFRLTLKARGDKLNALRLMTTDKTNNVLKIKGFVGLGVGKNSYALQSKFENGQVDAALVTVPNLADKLEKATVFRLKLGIQNYYFALQGFSEGYRRLMMCMGTMPTKTLKVVNQESAVQDVPAVPQVTMAPPQVEMAPEMPAEPVDVVNAQALETVPEPIVVIETPVTEKPKQEVVENKMPAVEKKTEIVVAEKKTEPTPILPKWRAMKGEKLSSVLKKWAAIEGVKTHFAMDRDPVLSKDIVSNGSFAMAVNVLLKETGVGGNAPSAIVKNADGRVTHVAGYQGGTMARIAGRSVSDTHRWRALEGTDLRKVLKRWSKKNNVQFIWSAPETYLVRQSVKATVDYNKAVALLLAQFEGQSTRPVGELNIDPKTGQKSLVIKTSRLAS